MKPSPIAILTLALATGLSGDAFAQKTKTTCGPDVYLNVQVIGTPTAPNNNVLVSDGNEYYNHGSSRNVVARFQVDNCTHDFTLNLYNSGRSLIARLSAGDVIGKFFNFDRVHSVPLTPSALFSDEARGAWLASPFCTNGVQRTADGKIVQNADGSYQDNYGGCGIDELGNAYVVRGGGVSLDPDARLAFHRSPVDNPNACLSGSTDPACGASFLRVYHPFETQWVVKAESTATASHSVWSKGGYVFQGYETVPLEIVVNKQ